MKFYLNIYSKFRPVLAGYKIERRRRFCGSIKKTALTVKGIPEIESKLSGSSIPNFVAKWRFSSAIIGKGKLSTGKSKKIVKLFGLLTSKLPQNL